MDRSRLASRFALVVGLLVFVSGITHSTLGLSQVRRLLTADDASANTTGVVSVAWLFAGGAMCVLGAVLVLAARALARGSRTAWLQMLLIGLFYTVYGAWALWFRGGAPHFYMFLATGLLLVGPALFARPEFRTG